MRRNLTLKFKQKIYDYFKDFEKTTKTQTRAKCSFWRYKGENRVNFSPISKHNFVSMMWCDKALSNIDWIVVEIKLWSLAKATNDKRKSVLLGFELILIILG